MDVDYFRVMRIPFLAGHGFTGQEQDNQVRAYPKQLQFSVVIDQTLARRLFPGQSAVGKIMGPWAPGYRIVGVVGAVKQSDLSTPYDDGAIYFPVAATQNQQTIVVRTDLPIGTAAALIRHAVHDADPELAVFDVELLATLVSRSAGPREIASWLLVGFAVLSLALALLGIYAVLSYATSQRRKEIAIRIALGAQPRELLGSVMRGAWILTATGVFIGAGRLSRPPTGAGDDRVRGRRDGPDDHCVNGATCRRDCLDGVAPTGHSRGADRSHRVAERRLEKAQGCPS